MRLWDMIIPGAAREGGPCHGAELGDLPTRGTLAAGTKYIVYDNSLRCIAYVKLMSMLSCLYFQIFEYMPRFHDICYTLYMHEHHPRAISIYTLKSMQKIYTEV